MLVPAQINHHIQKQKRRYPLFLGIALLMTASYFLENFRLGGHLAIQIAAGLRLIVILVLLTLNFPIWKLPRQMPQFLKWSWVSLWGLPLSQVGVLVWPLQRISWDHIMYINGFVLLILSIASKILAGHAGDTGLLKKFPRWMLVYGSLITLGMSTRVSAFFVKSYNMHLGVAAIIVLLAISIWATIFLPKVFQIPEYYRE